MDAILKGIPQVICYLDDILVTGQSDAEHMSNLETVLERLQEHGVRLNEEKCQLFEEAAEYVFGAQGRWSTYLCKEADNHC